MSSQLPFGSIHFSLDYTGSVGTKYKRIVKELELKKKIQSLVSSDRCVFLSLAITGR